MGDLWVISHPLPVWRHVLRALRQCRRLSARKRLGPARGSGDRHVHLLRRGRHLETLMVLTHPGAHLPVADNVYGTTRAFCDGLLIGQGVEVEYFDPMIGDDIMRLIRDATTAVMFESPGSGTFEMPDIRMIAIFARSAGVLTVLDNTRGYFDFLSAARIRR